MKIDLHTHSIASGHGTTDTISDMAKVANKKGLSILGITDHGPATLGSCKASYFRSLKRAPRERFQISLLYGVELNILDYQGMVDLDLETLSCLDYAIISMHRQNIKPGTRLENTKAYILAMQNPKVKIIGHCDDEKYPVDYCELIQAAKEYHVYFEINNSSLSPNGYRGNTLSNDIEILKYSHQYQHPILLSSDSHGGAYIGDSNYSEKLLSQELFPSNLVLNNDLKLFYDVWFKKEQRRV